MMWNTILFDLDGTLTDSAEGVALSIQHALRTQGLEENDPAVLRSFVGPPLLKTFEETLGLSHENALEAVRAFRAHYNETGSYVNRVYAGVPDMLRQLRAAGKRMAVVTSKETSQAENILRRFALLSFFDAVVGCSPDNTGADKASLIRRALAQLSAQPGKAYTVMVGDRSYDAEAAEETGIASVGVLYGYGSAEELRAAGAGNLVYTVKELTGLLTGTAYGAAGPGYGEYPGSYRNVPPRTSGAGSAPQGGYGNVPQNGYGSAPQNAYGSAPQGGYGNRLMPGAGYQGDIRLAGGRTADPSLSDDPRTHTTGKRIWNILYPILIWFGISQIVGTIGTMIYFFAAIAADPSIASADSFAMYSALMEKATSPEFMRVSMYLSAVADVILIPVIYRIFRKDERRRGRNLTMRTLGKPKAADVVISCFMGLFISIVLNFAIAMTGLSEIMYEMNPSRYDQLSSLPLIPSFITLCILAPVLEELLFRGIIFRRLMEYRGFVYAAVFSAVLFGLVHLDVFTGICAFLIGVIMAIIYRHTGNLFVSMAFHFGFNFYSIITQILPMENVPDAAVIAVFFVAIVGAVLLFLAFWKRNREKTGF